MFVRGQYPSSALQHRRRRSERAYASAQARGFALRIVAPDGQEWRSAMLDARFSPPHPAGLLSIPDGRGQQESRCGQDYAAVHPEIMTFIGWVKGHARTESWPRIASTA